MAEAAKSSSNSQVHTNLEWELSNVERLPITPSCMYKVPKILHDANKDAFTPKVVSIGPYHWGSKNLWSMHSLKIRYLKSFLARSGLELGTLVKMAQGWEKEVRGSYDDECGGLNSDVFVQMILMDGIFIVEFTWQCSDGSPPGGDGGSMEESLKDDIMRDLMLLENQLPFFVLKGLADHYSFPGNKWIGNLTKVCIAHFNLMPKSADSSRSYMIQIETDGNNILHLVDFIHGNICGNSSSTSSGTYRGPKLQLSRSATELQQAGVKLRCAGDLILTDIGYMVNGVLRIPRLVVDRNTESLFRNIISYEHCHRKDNKFRSYVILMDCLINTSQDVELLVHSGIIQNYLGESEDVCTLFNNLYKIPMMDSSQFRFHELCKSLNEYSRDPWHKLKAALFRWMSQLGRTYFNSPWSIISLIAAFLLLALTIIQVACLFKGDRCQP